MTTQGFLPCAMNIVLGVYCETCFGDDGEVVMRDKDAMLFKDNLL